MTRRRAASGLVAVLAAAVLSGCVQLPASGPVVETGSGGTVDDSPGVFIDPRPPQQDASAIEIVGGFLDAMTATPIQTSVARQFLTEDAQASWNPELGTITYADASPPQGGPRVTVTLTGGDRLDARGAWQGPLDPGDETLQFPVVLEGGEWRIATAPDALIVPQAWFEQRFRQAYLYFFDPTARILVPEPVFVPRGEQLATALVRGLLRGPGAALAQVSRSFLPAGLSVDLSVPVSDDGVAEISLTGEAGRQSPGATNLMLAQLAWTLRQEDAIRELRVSMGGQPLQLRDGADEITVEQGSEFDPTGFLASSQLFVLRDGLLVSGPADALEPVAGRLGRRDFGLRSLAVNLTGATAAGISADGGSVLRASVREPGPPVTEVLSGATDLLRPAWDFAGRLWLVDRTPDGARVYHLENGRARRLEVPGVTGRDVRRFLVSRDGTRLVALVRRPRGDVLMISRVRHSDQGRVVDATPAEPSSWEGSRNLRARDIAWITPTTVAVLHRLATELYEVRSLSVDGAPAGLEGVSTTLSGRFVALAGSPVEGESLYAVTGSSLRDLSSPDGGVVTLDQEIGTVGYVG